ncbi:MAG TPA: 3'(2'),5'-bisphosphate nucleotidase CysQ [Pyrinomonadaceae bacterium]|jgi:3'(2'), 5'-bisphosphate nucleotidase|nr:3'(2'),5'-bisphosphate nucleotidase CysQ [Pyrinomonadaceae bacterium]
MNMELLNSYTQEMTIALELAREAGAAILELYDGPIEVQQKSGVDDREPVTAADKLANEIIVGRLQREFPGDGILAEESVDTTHRLDKSRVWMIDPLDGTNGFIAGDGDFAVQIGLTENGECVLGVVYQPLTQVLYRAVRGQGTWIERPDHKPAPARVSDHSEVSSMRLAASRSHRSPRMDRVVQAFGLKEEVLRGSVGIKVGLIVEQQCDLYVHLSSRTRQWDTCAPEVILREAGGMITDLFGQPLRYNKVDTQNRNGLIASNGVSHQRIVASLGPLLLEFGREPVA